MEWRSRITADPAICHGKACIMGTRVLVSVLLDSLAAGESPEQVATAFRISRDDLSAALASAAELARERTVWTAA